MSVLVSECKLKEGRCIGRSQLHIARGISMIEIEVVSTILLYHQEQWKGGEALDYAVIALLRNGLRGENLVLSGQIYSASGG